MRVLKLTLKKEPFEVMETGEKPFEFRNQGEWIMSRLINLDGTHKQYDAVEFTNGYGATRPKFLCKYLGFDFARNNYQVSYSNGLIVDVKFGNVVIKLGELIK